VENAPLVLAIAERIDEGLVSTAREKRQGVRHFRNTRRHHPMDMVCTVARPWEQPRALLRVESGHVMRHPDTVADIRRLILAATNEDPSSHELA